MSKSKTRILPISPMISLPATDDGRLHKIVSDVLSANCHLVFDNYFKLITSMES